MLEEKIFQPRVLYLAKLSFRIEGKIKAFPNKQKVKEFVTTKLALQEMLKEHKLKRRHKLVSEKPTQVRISLVKVTD